MAMSKDNDWANTVVDSYWKGKEEVIDARTIARRKKFQDLIKQVKKESSTKIKEEPVPDYEHIQLDRRKDQDYIEKLPGDYQVIALLLCELISQGKADFLFIEYPQIQEIWQNLCTGLSKLRAKETEQNRIREIKESALNKLTEEEKKVLGIK